MHACMHTYTSYTHIYTIYTYINTYDRFVEHAQVPDDCKRYTASCYNGEGLGEAMERNGGTEGGRWWWPGLVERMEGQEGRISSWSKELIVITTYIPTNTHTDRQTQIGTQTNRQTHTDTKTDRHEDKNTHRRIDR